MAGWLWANPGVDGPGASHAGATAASRRAQGSGTTVVEQLWPLRCPVSGEVGYSPSHRPDSFCLGCDFQERTRRWAVGEWLGAPLLSHPHPSPLTQSLPITSLTFTTSLGMWSGCVWVAAGWWRCWGGARSDGWGTLAGWPSAGCRRPPVLPPRRPAGAGFRCGEWISALPETVPLGRSGFRNARFSGWDTGRLADVWRI